METHFEFIFKEKTFKGEKVASKNTSINSGFFFH